MREFFNNAKGFTLIEILVAVTIVGISFAVIVDGYMSMSRLVQQMKEYQLASSFAREKMNNLVQKIDKTTSGTETLNTLKVTWNAIYINVGDGVRRLTVAVDWENQKGKKEFQLTTLVEGGTYE